MMEKLGAPQTHLSLKAMIKEVDEDNDNKISFREVYLFTFKILFFLSLYTHDHLPFNKLFVFIITVALHFIFNYFSRFSS